MEDRGACWTLTGVTVACVAALYLPGVQRTVPGGDSARADTGEAGGGESTVEEMGSRVALLVVWQPSEQRRGPGQPPFSTVVRARCPGGAGERAAPAGTPLSRNVECGNGELITTACELGRKCPEWCQAFPPAPWSSLSAVGTRFEEQPPLWLARVIGTAGCGAPQATLRCVADSRDSCCPWEEEDEVEEDDEEEEEEEEVVVVVVVEEEEVVLVEVEEDVEVAHPPGYPVFTLLSRLAMYLLPSLSPAHSVNLVCSLLGALASGALCYTVCRWAAVGQATGSALRERKCFPGDWPSARTAVAPEPHPASLFLRGNSMHTHEIRRRTLSCPG
ncbi:hypothetical protein CRUP_027410 [Coryphaenoides rupestris]|nr:hypothetical protein CRUP_027410 [Coryphaenoides rupestris]